MAERGEPLSERELDVLECLVQGATNREIANELHISHNTVKVHLRNIFTKLGVSSRTEATTLALQTGLLTKSEADSAESEPISNDFLSDPTEQESKSSLSPDNELQEKQSLAHRWRIPVIIFVLIGAFLLLALASIRFAGVFGLDGSENSATTVTVDEPLGASNWWEAQPMPRERANMALAAVGLDLYQIGGEVDAGVVSLVDVYETDSQQWRTAASKPTAVADTTAAVLFGEIFVPGGRLSDGQPTSVVEAYSPANNAWRPVAPLPKPIAGSLALSDGNLLYLFGGWDGGQYLNDVYVYNPSEDAWQVLPAMKQERAFATGGLLANQLFVVGGLDDQSDLSTCEYYDPAESNWSKCPQMIMPRAAAGAAVLGNELLYVIGGGRNDFVPFGEVLDPILNEWQEIEMPMLANQDSWHDLGVANVETRIYVQGGRQGNQILPSNFYYAPLIYRTYLPTVGDDRRD
jgi:DNA-binding CsgD family transcriptional regulator